MEEQRKKRTMDELAAENESLKAEVERLQQQVDMLRKAAFGQRSEKKVLYSINNPEQLSLFNEAETEARREESEEVSVPAHKRAKKHPPASRRSQFHNSANSAKTLPKCSFFSETNSMP